MSNHHRLILVTGAARSGKSEWAEHLAFKSGLPVIYLATARLDPEDQLWQERINLHRQRRPSQWLTLEVSHNLAQTILEINKDRDHCLLIDSLGTYVANLLAQSDSLWQDTQTQLLYSLQQSPHQIIIVGEETGWGVIPSYASGRTFRDRLGHLIRLIGAIADTVYLVTGGYALNLSQLGEVLPPRQFP